MQFCNFKTKGQNYTKKQRGMIPFFHLLNYFFCSLKYLLCEKLYILHCNYPLLTTTKGYHFASCENIPSPSQTLSLPPSPPPPLPAPILLEKGCGHQEGIKWHWEADCWGEVGCWQCGDAEALQSSSWWLSQPKPSKSSNDVNWVVFEGRLQERRIQLQWNRNTSAKSIFQEWWFWAGSMMNDGRMRVG